MQFDCESTASTTGCEVRARLVETGWIPPEKAAEAAVDFQLRQDYHLALLALDGQFVAAEEGSLAGRVVKLLRQLDEQHNAGLVEASLVATERNNEGSPIWPDGQAIANIILALRRRMT
jgi:hypothetical protein